MEWGTGGDCVGYPPGRHRIANPIHPETSSCEAEGLVFECLAISNKLEISLCSSCHDSLVGTKKNPSRFFGKLSVDRLSTEGTSRSKLARRESDPSCSFYWQSRATSKQKCNILFLDKRSYSIGASRYSEIGGFITCIARLVVGLYSGCMGRQDRTDQTQSPSAFYSPNRKVRVALKWLCQHNEDYRAVQINEDEIRQWPSVFVAEKLLDLMGRIKNAVSDDAS